MLSRCLVDWLIWIRQHLQWSIFHFSVFLSFIDFIIHLCVIMFWNEYIEIRIQLCNLMCQQLNNAMCLKHEVAHKWILIFMFWWCALYFWNLASTASSLLWNFLFVMFVFLGFCLVPSFCIVASSVQMKVDLNRLNAWTLAQIS